MKNKNSKHLVSIRRLDDYIRLVCDAPDADFTRSAVQEGIGTILRPRIQDARRHFIRLVEKDEERALDQETMDRILGVIHGERAVDKDKIISALKPQSLALDHLPLGAARDGEIEVLTALSDKNLIGPPVDRWVHVYVDRVQFWTRWDDLGRPVPSEERYVRIETPGRQDGAVVLPVDESSGRVCLVTQFRHPMRRLITEAPRGFADPGIDANEIATAHRELGEEANLRAGELVLLKRAYLDTGKLADRPSLFLAMVDRRQQEARYVAKKPLMLDPVWVPLLDFYEAVFATGDHAIDPELLEFVHLGPHQRTRLAKSSLALGYLGIEDAFTIQVALLALPRLKRRFAHLFESRRGPWT